MKYFLVFCSGFRVEFSPFLYGLFHNVHSNGASSSSWVF